MVEIDRERPLAFERLDEGRRLVLADLPGRAAADAMEMAVRGDGADVELLAAVGAVAVAEQAELLEDVQGPIDGRWRRRRVDGAAALDEPGAGHVAFGVRQDVDERPALGCPAQTSGTERVPDVGPGDIFRRFVRSDRGHRAKG